MKTCLQCGEVKPLESFHRCNKVSDGRKARCSACCNENSRKWRAENPDKQRECVESWRSRNRDRYDAKKRDSDSAYRKNNSSRIRAYRDANSEKLAARLRAWKADNRERVRGYEQKRRAQRRTTEVAEVDFDLLWAQCGGVCPDCGEGISLDREWPDPLFASVDHIVPLSRGGAHVQSNLRYTCLLCNLRKGDRSLPANTRTVSSVPAP